MIFTEENALPNWFCHFNHACKELAILFWQMFHWLHLFMKYTPSRLSSLNGISALFQALLCQKGGVSRHSECKDYAPPPPCANLRFMPENICVFVCICTAPPAWYSTVTHSGQLRVLVPHFYFSFLGYYINHATIPLAVEKFLMLPRAWGHYRMREIHCRDR